MDVVVATSAQERMQTLPQRARTAARSALDALRALDTDALPEWPNPGTRVVLPVDPSRAPLEHLPTALPLLRDGSVWAVHVEPDLWLCLERDGDHPWRCVDLGPPGPLIARWRTLGGLWTEGAYALPLMLAESAARGAADLLLAELRRPEGPRSRTADKAPADTRAEAHIVAALDRAFPSFGVRVEEEPKLNRLPDDPDAHIWLIDPNDGTTGYLQGYRGSSVSIALVSQGEPVLGVILAYAAPDDRGDAFAWALGCGPLRRNGAPIERAPWPLALGPKVIIALSHEADLRSDANLAAVAPARYLPVPGIAYRLALAAAGSADAGVSVFGPKDYDFAAGHALLRGTGGVLVDERGASIRYDDQGRAQARACFGGGPDLVQDLTHRDWGRIWETPDVIPAHLDLVAPVSGERVDDPALLARAVGALLGLLVGDALGACVEGIAPNHIQARLDAGAKLTVAPSRVWDTLAGQPTDDGEVALTLARALVGAGGWDADAAARAYGLWARSEPFATDDAIAQTCANVPDADDLPGAALARDIASHRTRDASFGPLLRAVVLGLVGFALPERLLISVLVQDATLTHAHPASIDAAVLVGLTVAHAVRTGARPSADLHAWACARAEALSLHRSVTLTLSNAAHKLPSDFTYRPDWSLIALQNLFHHVASGATLRAALRATLGRGGRSATHAALVTALYGACLGRSVLPPEWCAQVLTCRPCETLPTCAHPRPRWCWPVDAPILAERLALIGLRHAQTAADATPQPLRLRSTRADDALAAQQLGPSAPPRAPFQTSPSALARYIYLDCERAFRYRATRPDEREAQHIPTDVALRSPIMDALADDGYRWEADVLDRFLVGRVEVPEGDGPLADRNWTPEQTLDLLRTTPPGRFIYQACFRPPPSFYVRYGLDPNLLAFSDCYPDLIQVLPDPERPGHRLLRILDVKRSLHVHTMYRAQILLYALLLDRLLLDAEIEDARADLSTGGVWLGESEAPEPCDLSSIHPHLMRFLRHGAPRILRAPASEASWHVQPRCTHCRYLPHCRAQMVADADLSRLPGLTAHAKRFLQRDLHVADLPQLRAFLDHDDARIDDALTPCASLTGQRPWLRAQTRALIDQAPVPLGASSPALARATPREVLVFLTLQTEPLHRTTYLVALRTAQGADVPTHLLGGPFASPNTTLIAHAPADVPAVHRAFVQRLHGVLQRVHAFNHANPPDQRLSVQLVVYAHAERAALNALLLDALRDPDLGPLAIDLLLALQGPDRLDDAAAHAADNAPSSHPVVVLESTLERMLALPVDVAFTLPEVLVALGDTTTLPRDDDAHPPLSHGLRADPVALAWSRQDDAGLRAIAAQAERLLDGAQAVLRALRERIHARLFALPPRFAFPDASPLKRPLLARLTFLARYESYIACLQTRAMRLDAPESQRLKGDVVQLEAVDAEWMRVIGTPVALSDDDFPNRLLIPDTPEGQRAQLTFDDYRHRQNARRWRPHPHRAVVATVRVISDDLGYASFVRLGFQSRLDRDPPQPGERFLLYPRFTDFNTDRVVAFLRRLDGRPPTLLAQALDDPAPLAQPLPDDPDLDAQLAPLIDAWEAPPSKHRAVSAALKQPLSAIWGPPGTGKTHALAMMVLLLARAHSALGRPLRVLVTAFTHAAIENLLVRVMELMEADDAEPDPVRIVKAHPWYGQTKGASVPARAVGGWLTRDDGPALVGSTVYGILRAQDVLPAFDLVIVDEASQLRLPEAMIPASLVHPQRGRLVLAGDHFQLAPILAAEYPPSSPDDPDIPLHRSVFETVQHIHATTPPDIHLLHPLLENYRMNDVLTSVSASLLYPNYTCADDATAQRRLPWSPPQDRPLDPLLAACLDPSAPLVLVLLHGLTPARENLVEASLVADLVVALRLGLRDDRAGAPYASDADFFKRGACVLSPHHTQLRLIRRELHDRRDWTARPFVDTVDKMQGQQADAVLVSYGVSDAEFASREAAFIYARNRLNVSITRARTKTIVCLPQPLIEATPHVLDDEQAAQGLAFMRQLIQTVRSDGESLGFALDNGVRVEILRLNRQLITRSQGMQPEPIGTVADASGSQEPAKSATSERGYTQSIGGP